MMILETGQNYIFFSFLFTYFKTTCTEVEIKNFMCLVFNDILLWQ